MALIKFKVIKPVQIRPGKTWEVGTTGEMDQELFNQFKDSLEEVKVIPISDVVKALKNLNKPQNAMAKHIEKETAAKQTDVE